MYRDIQTPAQYEYFYKQAQSDERLFLMRAHERSVTAGSDRRAMLDIDSTLLGSQVRIGVDLLVLSTEF